MAVARARSLLFNISVGNRKKSLDYIEKVHGLNLSEEGGKPTFRLSAPASQGSIPDSDPWLRVLGGETYSWRHALFTNDVFVQGNKFQDNPMRRIFSPAHGMVVEIINPRDPAKTVIAVDEQTTPVAAMSTMSRLRCRNRKRFSLNSLRSAPYRGSPRCSHPGSTIIPRLALHLREVQEGSNDRIKEF